MQRQSLGGGSSPGSKHHHNINGGVSSSSKEVSRLLDDEEEEAKEETTTPTPTRKEKRGVGGLLVVVSEIEEDEGEKKKKKKKTEKHGRHHHLRSIKTEKSIHLIPILTISCLLILYLCSYDPPLKDLAHIDGFRRISKRIDDSTTDQIDNGLAGRFSSDHLDDKATDVLLPMIRSHRSLHEIRKDDGRRKRKSIHRFHRKIGDYSPVPTHS